MNYNLGASVAPAPSKIACGSSYDGNRWRSDALRDCCGASKLHHVIVSLIWFALSLTEAIDQALTEVDQAILSTDANIETIEGRWKAETAEIEKKYLETLRDLQKEGIDGAEFVTTQNQVAELAIKEQELAGLIAQKAEALRQRRELIVLWEDVKAGELRALETAARR
jgi:hypothetical protein